MPKDLTNSLELRGFEFRKLFNDIPLKLKMCVHCRKAVKINAKKCEWCNYDKFMPI